VPLVLPPDDPCWFCRYLAGTAPYTILERDDTTATLVTFEQRGQGHVLVVPIRHVKTVIELAPHEQWAVMDAVARSTRSILGAFDPSGVAVWQNNGIPAHQTVPHVHVHVAGTLTGGGTEWGTVERLATSVTDQIAARLQPHLPPRDRKLLARLTGPSENDAA
jgi:histidine triad (HIT) family protein